MARVNSRHLDLDARELLRIFESLHERGNPTTVFEDVVECLAIAIFNQMPHDRRDEFEERYHSIRKRYSPVGFQKVCDAAGQVMLHIVNSMKRGADGTVSGDDVLGRLFMQIGAATSALGQCFSPYSVCKMMAMMTLSDVGSIIREKGFVTIAEPAVGGGAMILAAADIIESQGFNVGETLYVEARDLDRRAVAMAYVQLSLRGIPAHVILGNTLAMEEREVWVTPAYVKGNWSEKLRGPIAPITTLPALPRIGDFYLPEEPAA